MTPALTRMATPLYLVIFALCCNALILHACHVTSNGRLLEVDCSRQALVLVPDNLPEKTTSLKLSNNQIVSLPPDVFHNMTELIMLDLSNNPITTLPQNLLRGLYNLSVLDLSFTNLKLNYESYPKDLFLDNTQLKVLKLGYHKTSNMPQIGDVHPLETMLPLVNLEDLTLSPIPNKPFDSRFSHFTKLKRLTVQKGALFENLGFSTFASFNKCPIQELSMISCYTESFHPMSMSHFSSLKSLNIACMHSVPLSDIMLAVSKIPSSLHTLVIAAYQFTQMNLSVNEFCFPNLYNLERLSIGGFILAGFDPNTLLCFPFLRYLSFTYMDIFPFEINNAHLSSVLYKLDSKLIPKVIDVSFLQQTLGNSFKFKICWDYNQYTETEQFFKQPPQHIFHYPIKLLENVSAQNILPQSVVAIYVNHDTFLSNAVNHHCQRHSTKRISNNLRYVNASFIPLKNACGSLAGMEKLSILDISYCGISSFLNVHINMSGLQELYAHHNDISQTTLNLKETFRQMPNLEMLDLSYNRLRDVGNLFTALLKLRILKLSHNNIKILDFTWSSFQYLEQLDISHNNIVFLDMAQYVDIETHGNPNLTMILYGNPFDCDCSHASLLELDRFINWARVTKHLADGNKYMCNDSVRLLDMSFQNLERKCTSDKRNIHISTIGLHGKYAKFLIGLIVVVILLFMTITACYLNKWRIKWFYWKQRLGKFQRNGNDQDPEYDVFVQYAGADLDWVINSLLPQTSELQIEFCLEHKDFLTRPHADNIVDAVDTSSKTLLVLSDNFLADEWGEFALQMSVGKGLQGIVIFQIHDIHLNKVSRLLSKVMDKVPYIKYNDTKAWQRLAQVLR